MTIRNAEPKDAARILEIIESAKLSIRALGIDQWQNGYPNMESVLSDIENGIGRVLEENGEIIAAAAVYVGNEPTYDRIFDGAWLTRNDTYGIIHRIAVAPEGKNRGAASQMMAYCTALSQKAGVSSLRCDTHPGNVIMRHTLEKNGYHHCGTIYLEDGSARVGYEKML